MKITPSIIDAINKAIVYYGNVSQVAKNMGVAHSTVLFWTSLDQQNPSRSGSFHEPGTI